MQVLLIAVRVEWYQVNHAAHVALRAYRNLDPRLGVSSAHWYAGVLLQPLHMCRMITRHYSDVFMLLNRSPWFKGLDDYWPVGPNPLEPRTEGLIPLTQEGRHC